MFMTNFRVMSKFIPIPVMTVYKRILVTSSSYILQFEFHEEEMRYKHSKLFLASLKRHSCYLWKPKLFKALDISEDILKIMGIE